VLGVKRASGVNAPVVESKRKSAVHLADFVTTWPCVLLLHYRRHQVRNYCHRTLGIAAYRPYFFNDAIAVAVWTGFHACLPVNTFARALD